MNGQHAGQDFMHQSMTNGPTLSPRGQESYPPKHGGNPGLAASPPPGLRSPPGPPAYTNGYTNHVSYQNGIHPRPHYAFPESQSSRFSGTGQSNTTPQNTAWSATYEPPRAAHTPNQATPLPPSANPFHNSFDRQRPDSSHSPLMNGPNLSPTPSAYSPASNARLPLGNSTPNGLPSQTYSLPPPLPPPVKQQSSPPATIVNHLPSSSPIIGPNLHREAPPSPGLSPTKHTSPRPAPLNNSREDEPANPSASFQTQLLDNLSPIKQTSPRPQPVDPSSSPIGGPALHNRSPSNPGYSPTKQMPPKAASSMLGNGVEQVMPPVENLAPSPKQAEAALHVRRFLANGETE